MFTCSGEREAVAPDGLKADECIRFKLVRSPEEARAAMSSADGWFNPEFTHQLFDDELVHGWSRLTASILLDARTMAPCLVMDGEKLTGDARVNATRRDDLAKLLGDELAPTGYTTDVEAFAAAMAPEAAAGPAGPGVGAVPASAVQVASYTGSGGETFRVFNYNVAKHAEQGATAAGGGASAAHAKLLTARLEFLVPLFIDAGSAIEEDDERWEMYLVTCDGVAPPAKMTAGAEAESEQAAGAAAAATTESAEGKKAAVQQPSSPPPFSSSGIVSFTTLYRFFSYPDGERHRISQFLTMPPFQRAGHGKALLRAVYGHCRSEGKCSEVVVEDPAEAFSCLRDRVDLLDAVAGVEGLAALLPNAANAAATASAASAGAAGAGGLSTLGGKRPASAMQANSNSTTGNAKALLAAMSLSEPMKRIQKVLKLSKSQSQRVSEMILLHRAREGKEAWATKLCKPPDGTAPADCGSVLGMTGAESEALTAFRLLVKRRLNNDLGLIKDKAPTRIMKAQQAEEAAQVAELDRVVAAGSGAGSAGGGGGGGGGGAGDEQPPSQEPALKKAKQQLLDEAKDQADQRKAALDEAFWIEMGLFDTCLKGLGGALQNAVQQSSPTAGRPSF